MRRSTIRSRFVAPAAVTLTLLATAALLVAPTGLNPAAAMLGGSIEGTVSEASGGGLPIAGIRVCAFSDIDDDCDVTDSNGAYHIAGLSPASDYAVTFRDEAEPKVYVDELYDSANLADLQTATLVAVSEGVITGNINAQLAVGGSISGAVTTGQGVTPVQNETVCASSPTVVSAGCVLTAADGTFVISGLATASDYEVLFIDSTNTYMDEYFDDVTIVSGQSSPTSVSVVEGAATPGIDADLENGGFITGTITDANGPLAGASVTALPIGDFPVPAPRSATTGADGTYAISGLSLGFYDLLVETSQPTHTPEYFDNKFSLDTADWIFVIEGLTNSGNDVELGFGGSISGSVTDIDGPLPATAFVGVCARSLSNPEAVGCAEVMADGSYLIERLPPASDYQVVVEDGGYSTQFYDATVDPTAATLLTVAEGTAAIDVDFVLNFKRSLHLLDTACTVLQTGLISGGDSIDFEVAGTLPASQNSSPASCPIPAGADAVFANVIVDNPVTTGNLRLTAAGTTPQGGIVNFGGNGLGNSNAQSVPLSASQGLNVSVNTGGNKAAADGLTIEILGWYERSEGTGLGYVPNPPCAFFDSRNGAGQWSGPFTANTNFTVDLVGDFSALQGAGSTTCDIDGSDPVFFPSAALVNLVLIQPQGGEAQVVGNAAGATGVNNVSLTPGLNNSSAVVLPVDSNGRIDLGVILDRGAQAHVRAILLGTYYDRATLGAFVGYEYEPLTPCAVFDTRSGSGATGGFLGTRLGDEATDYDVTGAFDPAQGGGQNDCGVPDGAFAVEINLVAPQAVRFGNLKASATGEPASGGVVNFGSLIPPMNNSNAIVLPVSDDGRVTVTVNGGPTGVGLPVTDIRGVITGYYR